MGQEVSVPANQTDSLEEQAKAAPSTSNVDHLAVGRAGPGTGRTSRKIMGAMFRQSGITSTVSQNNNIDFEQREASRAAALGGHIYIPDGSIDEYTNGNTSYTHNELQIQLSDSGRDYDTALTTPSASNICPPQQNLSEHPQMTSVSQQHSHLTTHSVVGMLFDKQQSAKKGLFANRGTRGVINTMRNLTLTGTLRKQKEATDWEKQWDDDDDDDSDGLEGADTNGAPQHLVAQVSPLKLPPQSSSLQTPEARETAPHTMVSPQQSDFLYENSLSSDVPGVSPVSPPRNLQQPPCITPNSTEDRVTVSMHQIADDLLSKPVEDCLPSANHQSEDDNVDWDIDFKVPAHDNLTKPSVNMFMPMLRVLGKGSFGKVVLVQKREGKDRGQLFAMKILKKTHLVKRRQIERTRTERIVLSVVNHPFIMKLHYAFQSTDKLYFVLDYCPGGELFFHLSRFRRFPERVARFYSAELLLAIGHLHKRGIIYRDLKPENVLLDADGHLKLGDFGLAKTGISHALTGATSMCGTPEYMAPEVLAQSGHGFCVDYWGLGMIAYEMMTGLPPWYTTDRAQLFRRLKSAPLDIPSYFSVAAANCISALLERNPRRRLGVAGIRTAMEHEFFRNISWRSLYSRRLEAPVRPCEGWRPPEPAPDQDDLSLPHSDHNGFSTSEPSAYSRDFELMDSAELDTATQNFDNQFTRMPVESDDQMFDPAAEGINLDELNAETFLGFSFDIVKHREEEAAVASKVAIAEEHSGSISRPVSVTKIENY